MKFSILIKGHWSKTFDFMCECETGTCDYKSIIYWGHLESGRELNRQSENPHCPLADPGCQCNLHHVTSRRPQDRTEDKAGNNWVLTFSIGSKHKCFCSPGPTLDSPGPMSLWGSYFLPRTSTCCCATFGSGHTPPAHQASEVKVEVLACGSKCSGPLRSTTASSRRGPAYGVRARNSLQDPREPALCCQVDWSSWWIFHVYWRLLELFYSSLLLFDPTVSWSLLIQHADYMRTRFSSKNKTHNDSVM